MTVKTKYNIGDTVCYYRNNKINQATIDGIWITGIQTGKPIEIGYGLADIGGIFYEPELWPTEADYWTDLAHQHEAKVAEYYGKAGTANMNEYSNRTQSGMTMTISEA